MKKVTLKDLPNLINKKTVIITDSKNVNFLKKEMFDLNIHTLVKVTDINSFVKKSGVRPVSSIVQKMYFYKALVESGISKYNIDLVDYIIKTYKDEVNMMLSVIGETTNYKLYEKVVSIYKKYEIFDYESALIKLVNELNYSDDLIIYDVTLTKLESILINKLTSLSSTVYELDITINDIKYIRYDGTDLYNEVLFVANQIANINDLNNTCIVTNKVADYLPYIDLIFNENGIGYNGKMKINSYFIDSLSLLIQNKKNNYFKNVFINKTTKEGFLKSVFNLCEELDEHTYSFLVSFIDSYDTVFDELDIDSFCNLLKSYSEKNVNVPLIGSVDVLSLDELNKSYKHVFFMGVNRGELSLPKYNNLFIKYSELNKIYGNYDSKESVLNHLAILKNALTAAKTIYLTTHKVDANNSSSEIDELIKKITFDKIYSVNDTICFSYLKKSFMNRLNIIEQVKTDVTNTVRLNLDDTSINLSPSKLDTYNKCHFSYYCKYLLKLEEDYVEFDNRHIGSYVHLLFEKAIESTDFASDFRVIEAEYKTKFKSPIIRFLIEKITDNIIELYPIVKKELDHNDFSVKYREINLKEDPLIINVNNASIKVSGIIDRVDESSDYVRIVDYKTGSKEINLNEIILGINLQLFIYMVYFEKKYGKKVSGIFYQKALVNFSKNDSYLLDGLVLDTSIDSYGGEDVADYLNVMSRGKLNPKKVISSEKFELLSNYTIKKITDSASSMLSGDISINPIDKTCDYCPYSAICGIEYPSKNIRYITREEDVLKKMEDELNGVY